MTLPCSDSITVPTAGVVIARCDGVTPEPGRDPFHRRSSAERVRSLAPDVRQPLAITPANRRRSIENGTLGGPSRVSDKAPPTQSP